MLKFNLTVNEQNNDGFKLSFTADTKEELDKAHSLSKELISKITKIEVSVHNYEE